MVASMEVTASHLVEHQLVKKHKVNKIKLIGALLNYKTKTGTIYILNIDFETNTSISCETVTTDPKHFYCNAVCI